MKFKDRLISPVRRLIHGHLLPDLSLGPSSRAAVDTCVQDACSRAKSIESPQQRNHGTALGVNLARNSHRLRLAQQTVGKRVQLSGRGDFISGGITCVRVCWGSDCAVWCRSAGTLVTILGCPQTVSCPLTHSCD